MKHHHHHHSAGLEVLFQGPRRQTIEALVPAWDSDIIFKALCYFHTLYPGLIPLETFPPATIFNFKQKIISILEDKKAVLRGEPIKGPLPISCSKENYRRHLQRTTLLPVFMWYHPTPKTLSDTMQTMKQLAIKGSVGASHWLLVIVDIQARRLVYFDSLYNYVMPPENMKKELQSFAQQLDQVYPAYDSKKFSVKIAAKEVIQRGSGSSCGAWCCQFLHWYLKDPLTDALNDLPVDSVERHENLASFVQAAEAAVQDLPELSWPEA
uniref:Deubiquitinase and deneddylase Dub1 n=1 Tax=Chlamydia trachomatis serovar L2 (strain ATCC VR-902B / DSM 19102 / 434/Bu) TaxID=471472 RepID=UPI000E20C8CA|nr:Chain A, Deubiquitinase and deneddylase Dub1 [Chlamydia trachomatis 434/Bu]